MSTRSNLFSQGGGGPHFEFETHTALFIIFILGSPLPFAEDEKIVKYRQQSGSLDYKTDDLLLWTEDGLETEHRNLVQIKHGLVISANETFEEVLVKMWMDFKNLSLFDKTKDRLVIIKDNMTKAEKNHLQKIGDWSRVKSDEDDFTNEVSRIKEKKKYYDLFVSILNKAGIACTAVELHDFFKCFYILEYDLADTVSTARTNLLSLIILAKAPDAKLNPAEIWATVYRFISSSDSKGGLFEWKSIPAALTAHFNKDHFPSVQKQLDALSMESREIINFIRTDIGSVTMERTSLLDEAREMLASKQVLIITGEPGSGKSTLSKMLLDEFNGHMVALKADELASGNLTDIFKSKGIDLTITEFFNHFPLNSRHVIYVDALEKLLEGDGEAFIQLLKVLKHHPDILLIASSRKRNFNLLQIKFFSDTPFEKLEIGPLTAAELVFVAKNVPELKEVIANKKLASLVKVPQYLDMAYRAIKVSGKTFSSATEPEFIQDLWDIIIENKTGGDFGGLPSRRRESFIEVAVSRAKRMTPFVRITNPDHEALELLDKENVVIHSRSGQYAPSHDVLEDWGLVRHVESCFQQSPTKDLFFIKLGSEPAMRRAYRLWVQEAFKTKSTESVSFISSVILGNDSEKYWQDESLISLLQSEFTETFLQDNGDKLMNDNWKLFARFLHILRTACRENEQSSWEKRYYIPVGSGWHAFIKYIRTHQEASPERFYPLIILLLEDYCKLNYAGQTEVVASREAGLSSLFLLEFFRAKTGSDYENKIVLQCLKLCFEFADGIKMELEQVLDEAYSRDDESETPSTWMQVRYQQEILTKGLEGLSTGQLPHVFPDKLITLARKRWYYVQKKVSASSFGFSSRTPDEEVFIEFGLNEDEITFEAPSAYSTFLYKLLKSHPQKAIDFILEFVHKSTTTFLANHPPKPDELSEFEIDLPDGSSRNVKGYPRFWSTYRGNTGVPKLLEAVLMALERYLIELGNQGEFAKSLFKSLLEKLTANNESLFISGVLASVVQAHPAMAGEWALPLLTNKGFIFLDLQRYAQDMMLDRIGLNDEFHKERMDAGNMPHRQRFFQGIKALTTEPILYYEGYGPKIENIIDKHRSKLVSDELDWKRHLDDMDYRTYRLTKTTTTAEGKQLAYFTSTHDEGVTRKMEEDKKNPPFDLHATGESNWLMSAYDHSHPFEMEQWKKIYDRYRSLKKFSWHEHSPGMLAALGIRDGWAQLDQDQKTWCAKTVFELLKEVKDYYRNQFAVGVFDKKALLATLPLLLVRTGTGLSDVEVAKTFFEWLQRPVNQDPDYGKMLQAFHCYVWKADSEQALSWWKGVIQLAALEKQSPSGQVGQKSLNDLFEQILKRNVTINIEEISLVTHDPALLAKAGLMLPVADIDDQGLDFLVKLMNLFYQYDVTRDRFSRDNDQLAIELEMKSSLEVRIPTVLVHAPYSKGERLLNAILDHVTAPDFLENSLKGAGKYFEFFNVLFKQTFYEVENNGLTQETERKMLHSNFHQLWAHFDEYLTTKGTTAFSQYLLMDGSWNAGTTSWEPIAEMKEFLVQMIVKYGGFNLNAVINLLTYPASTMLMPKGISVLTHLMKNSKTASVVVNKEKLEKFVYRAYDKFYDQILQDQTVLSDLLWLLDNLVDNGSSDAYWIREFLISFDRPGKLNPAV